MPSRLLLVLLSLSLLVCIRASCLDCCTTPGACATAFNNAAGTCCGKSQAGTPFCCPSGANCVYNGPLATPAYSCAAPVSACSLCCKNGGNACATAFKGGPGMCCGSSATQSYCCPESGAMCVKSQFSQQFSCRRTSGKNARQQFGGGGGGTVRHVHHRPAESSFSTFVSNVFSLIFFVSIICCCCSMCTTYRQNQYAPNSAVYAPLPLQPGGMPMVPHAPVGYAISPYTGGYGHHSDGFVNGMMVANMMQHSHQPTVVYANGGNMGHSSYGGDYAADGGSYMSDGGFGGDDFDASN